MTAPRRRTRCLAALLGLLLVATASPALWAQDRCERYAQRAVEQYKLMRSHPGCQVKADLRWQDNYKNHLFACRHTPELLTKAENAARDQHLQSCGGLTTDSSSSAAGPTPTLTQPSAPSSSTATATPPGSAPEAGSRPCKVDLPPSFALAYGTSGTDGAISAGILHYRESKKHESKTYTVVRPTYYAEQQRCGQRPQDTTGPWLSPGAGGQSDLYFLLNANGAVQAWPLRHAVFEQLVAPPKP